ncbi:MAG: hypothetical protein JOZ69_10980, partial [Myxococcales bacterium]|nr:hypothetical protein [Myxococcales bacterium]
MLRRFLLPGAAVALSALFPSGVARAQVATAGAPSISVSQQINPNRVLPDGTTPPARQQNQNPLGINYQDCISDLSLHFNLLAANLDGSQIIQIWAGTSDCSSDVSRGIGGVATCWKLGSLAGFIAGAAPIPLPDISVRAQDIVAHQGETPPPTVYTAAGPDACTKQTVDTAQSITVFVLALDSESHAIANSLVYSYQFRTDLVGPPPPTGLSIADGDTLLQVSWTATSEADTAGYNLYIDPFPGQENGSGGGHTEQRCGPDSGMGSVAADA